MKSKFYSLKTAIILPVILLITLILMVEGFLWKLDYDFLAKEQGTKILYALNDTTQERLNHLLTEPQNVNRIMGQELLMHDLSSDTFQNVEAYFNALTHTLYNSMPQISAIGYGAENSNYIGIRYGADFSNLMLKDARTNGNLNVYSGKTLDTPILASYENYDPRTRPWYIPVKKSPLAQVSEIYVNYDEIMEATLTFISPVLDSNNTFLGVIGTDVKLNGINDFLHNDTTKGNGVIYILDEDNHIIAHSEEDDVMEIVPGDPPTASLMQATETANDLIKISAYSLTREITEYETIYQRTFLNQEYYILISPLRAPTELDWRIVMVIPESDLMGNVQKRNITTFIVLIILSTLGLGFGVIILNKVTTPIIDSTKTAVSVASGDWNATTQASNIRVKEIHALSNAINQLGHNIQESFEEIKFKETRYRSLINNVDAMIYSLSLNGYFLAANQRLLDQTGFTSEELIGTHYSVIFSQEDNIIFWDNLIRYVLNKKERIHKQFEYTGPDGKSRFIQSVTLIPIFNNDNKIVTLIGANTDITELIVAQEEVAHLLATEKERLAELVEQRSKELERVMNELIDQEKLASLGSLVSGISHEINTPLGVAVSAASLLEKNSQEATTTLLEGNMTKESLIHYISSVDETGQILTKNLERASALIKSFKEIAVNQSTEVKMTFNVYDYIQSILLSLKHEYKTQAHRFDIICDHDLELNSYSGALSQILTNLIMNSIIHGFKDIIGGHIIIEVIENQDTITLLYKDNGHGMTEEVRKRIFEPFYTTNRTQGGSGLGMNVVYNIVTGKLGGSISCQSTPESGSLFTVNFSKE